MTGDFGFLNCHRDVMLEVQSTCSGRRSCQIRVNDAAFSRVSPCHRDLKSYLVVQYSCTAGKTSLAGPSVTCALENFDHRTQNLIGCLLFDEWTMPR